MGNIGTVDFGELRGETATGGVAAVEDAVGAEFAHCHFDKTGGGIGAGDADADIFVGTDGRDTEFPVAAGVTADEGDVGETGGKSGDVIGGGFASWVACGFIPGVLKDDGFELGGPFDDRVDGWIGATLCDP